MLILKICRYILPAVCAVMSFQAEARRIISLSPAATEVVYLLGRGDELVGRSSACDHPARVKKLPVTGDFARPDTAKILKLKPDIVITNDLIVPSAANILRRFNIKVVFAPCRSIQGYREMIKTLGRELDAEKESAAELRRIDAFIEQCRKNRKFDLKILCLIWHHPVIAAGDRTLMSELLALAGAENCVKENITGYFKPSSGYLLNCGADAVLVFENPSRYRKNPVLRHMKAVKNGCIIYFPHAELLQRPGPRFTEGVLKLREYLEK